MRRLPEEAFTGRLRGQADGPANALAGIDVDQRVTRAPSPRPLSAPTLLSKRTDAAHPAAGDPLGIGPVTSLSADLAPNAAASFFIETSRSGGEQRAHTGLPSTVAISVLSTRSGGSGG